jgi:hypothetical protein
MKLIRTSLVTAASLLMLGGAVNAQNTDTRTETDRGVPGVDVDVGRNANGAVDVNTNRNTRDRGAPGVDVDVGRNADGAIDVNRTNGDRNMRAPRADRG